jgi:hypothetical protein
MFAALALQKHTEPPTTSLKPSSSHTPAHPAPSTHHITHPDSTYSFILGHRDALATKASMSDPFSGLSALSIHTYTRPLVPDTDLPSDSDSEVQLDGFLLKLPAEIRVMIYEQMFPRDKVNVYAINGRLHKSADAHHSAGDHTAMLATCRTIYAEAQPVLYNNTIFDIQVKNCYWTEEWTEADLKEVYGVNWESESDDWLENTHSLVPINQVRRLTLSVEVSSLEPEETEETWTEQLKNELRGVWSLQSLQISLRANSDEHMSQSETDRVLRIISQTIKCGGAVAGEMDPSLGSMDFDSTQYYRMLGKFRG